MQLPYQIQEFDSVSGKLIAWIKRSSVSDSSKTFIYYDNPSAIDNQNPTAVWDNNFKGVYHSDQVSGDLLDSTSNNNDGSLNGSVGEEAAGKIGKAVDYPGSNDYYNLGNSLGVLGNNPRTISWWAKIDNFQNGGIFQTGNPGPTYGEDFSFKANNIVNDWRVQLWGLDVLLSLPFSNMSFHHYVVVYDGTTIFLYYNGDLFTSVIPATPGINTTLADAFIGKWRNDDFDGIIDEIKFSNIVRSTDWIKTEYNNQNNPGAFYQILPEETTQGPDWFDTQWMKRLPLVVQNGLIPSTQTDFPLLIDGTYSELIGASLDELRFTDEEIIVPPSIPEDIDLQFPYGVSASGTSRIVANRKPNTENLKVVFK